MSREPYEARGILHSEMALVIETCRAQGIKSVIESGRARGQSTYMLAQYLPEAEIHSVELRAHPDESCARARLARFENVYLRYGDGNRLVPAIAAMMTRPCAILLDGPKGADAVTILKLCFELDYVCAGFIHDMRRLDHGGPSPHRADAIARLPNHSFSDDEAFCAEMAWMDTEILRAGGPCGPDHLAIHGSYGPTIGVFMNETPTKD